MDINIKLTIDDDQLKRLLLAVLGKQVELNPTPVVKQDKRVPKCRICGQEFEASRKDATFCSNECRRFYNAYSTYRRMHPEITLKQYIESHKQPEMVFKASTPKPQVKPAATPRKCCICGDTYVPSDESERYCTKCKDYYGSECADIEREVRSERLAKDSIAKTAWKVCPKCGRNSEDPKKVKFFCDECQKHMTEQKGKRK